MSSIQGKSINDLKSVLNKRGGLAMQNRFAVYMQPPQAALFNLDWQGAIASAISGNFKLGSLVNDPRDVALLCESASLPGRQIMSVDYQTVHRAIKIPNGYINEDVTLTFLLTNDYYIKKVLDKWSAMIIDQKKYRVGYLQEFTADVTIQQLDKNNVPIYGVTLKNAYPTSVNAVTLDNSAENTVQRVSVNLTYEDFSNEGAITSTISALKNGIGGIKKIFGPLSGI